MIGSRSRNLDRRLSAAAVILLIFLLFQTCVLFEPDPILLVKTDPIAGEIFTSCTASGTIVHLGEEAISQHGFCWSEQSNPNIESGEKIELGSRIISGIYSGLIDNLLSNTTYYLRAYAIDNLGTVYGDEISFTTQEISVPALITTDVTSLTDSSATGGGNITDDGGDTISVRGVCWSTIENPTLSDNHTNDGSGIGSYSSPLTGLTCGTLYFIRAYATSSAGTGYGQQVSFTTLSCSPGLPVVTTDAISSITDSSAQSGGNITKDGGDSITSRGVCWSISQNPTVSDNHTTDSSGTGAYTSLLTGLECNTEYFIRAYATNSTGTAYGSQLSFTTSVCPMGIPTVSTTSISSITETSAQSGGDIIHDGGAIITARGVCWSTSSNPTISDSHTTDGTGSGSFLSILSGLDPATTYFVRAYATNIEGTAYGDEVDFTTLTSSNTVTDYDGNTYQLIEIGYQTWMAENLKTTHFSDGTAILFVEDQTTWGDFGVEAMGYCYYNNNTTYGDTYGALYTWAAAMNGSASSHLNPSGIQGVCPTGWHLPSDAEWKQLELYLGMSQVEADSTGNRGTTEGGKLKETDLENWKDPNTGATNEYGFAALPGGWRNTAGAFLNRTLDAYFWSSTDQGNTQVWFRNLYYSRSEIFRDNYLWNGEGFSVRCVKDGGSVTMPIVTTTSISVITESSAQAGGSVPDDGGASVSSKGICWSTSEDPDLSDSYSIDGSGTGGYTSVLSGLTCGTTYFLKAYATNSAGTAYGEEISFSTTQCSVLPTVSTTSISGISEFSAESGGNITDDGGSSVTARGICWSTSQSPTTSDSKTTDGSGTGVFTSNMTGLSCGTTYYVRAFATNSAGTDYGAQVSFSSSQCSVPPTVSTTSVSTITETDALSGGNITSDGGAFVNARGVCWATSPDPTISDNHTIDGTGTGSFISSLSGLICETTYYLRAYASNSAGTAYGTEKSFTTDDCTTVTDYEGNIYQIVTIGTQIWMAENLKVTSYSDGAAIPLVEDKSTWDELTDDDKAYCFYNNSVAISNNYGALYTWAAAMNGAVSSTSNPSGVQGVCPTGWHIPSHEEWKQLEMHLGMSLADADALGTRGTNEGGKLKETGYTHWSSPNTGATNEVGFNARPSGYRVPLSGFGGLGFSNGIWEATEFSSSSGERRTLSSEFSGINRSSYGKNWGASVRCVKNE